MIPIFSSHYSLGRSILTLDPAEDIDIKKPVSIISIAKKYDLKNVYVVDTGFYGFIEAMKGCDKIGAELRYGIKFQICDNAEDQSPESLVTQSRIIIFIRNSAGYTDLVKLYSKAHSRKERFYYTGRLQYSDLEFVNPDNLLVCVDYYDGFIYNNLLRSGACLPSWYRTKPLIFKANCGLPFDPLLGAAVDKYAISADLKVQEVHPIYYYDRENFQAYTVFRCINNRTDVQAPELEHFSSSDFCWQAFCEKNNIKFLC